MTSDGDLWLDASTYLDDNLDKGERLACGRPAIDCRLEHRHPLAMWTIGILLDRHCCAENAASAGAPGMNFLPEHRPLLGMQAIHSPAGHHHCRTAPIQRACLGLTRDCHRCLEGLPEPVDPMHTPSCPESRRGSHHYLERLADPMGTHRPEVRRGSGAGQRCRQQSAGAGFFLTGPALT